MHSDFFSLVSSVPRRLALVGVAAYVGAGCAEKPAPAADTAAQPQQEAAPEAPPAAAAPESKVGKLPLLAGLNPDHQCSTQSFEGLTAIVKEFTYTGDVPPRIIRVNISAPERGFQIVNVESSIQQETSAGQSETERLFVIFTPAGDVQSGSREYTSTSDPSSNTKVGLLPSDSSGAKQLAQDVMDQCGRTS